MPGQEIFFQNLFDMIPLIIMILDSTGKVLEINHAGKDFIKENNGDPEYRGKFGGDIFRCIHRFDHAEGCTGCPVWNGCDLRINAIKALQGNTVVRVKGEITIENRNQHKTLHLLISTSPVSYFEHQYAIVVIEDITEKIILEEEVFKSQKLESVGALAGGIAHDFNNYLAAILSNIQLAGLRFKNGEDVQLILHKTEDVIIRATGLTRQLLAFSKGGAPVKKIADLKDMVIDTSKFVLRGKKVHCQFKIPDNLWLAEVDINQIAQVITNILINASQAMIEGIITIQCENIVLNSLSGLPLHPGDYIKTTIIDHGCGIPKETQSKIFDPFFTTKQDGSGLGLAICYSIIHKHNGYIGVESIEGLGTTIYFYLPAISRELSLITYNPEHFDNKFEHGKILFMDDEKIITGALREMLIEVGYEVDLAGEGSEAIEMFIKARDEGKPYDIVILDLTVPGGIGGEQTVKQLIEIDPHVKAIGSSGYSDSPILANPDHYHFQDVVTKPYKIEELRQILLKIIHHG